MDAKPSIVGRAIAALVVGLGAAVLVSGAGGATSAVTVGGPVTVGVGIPRPVSSNCMPGAGASSPAGSETPASLQGAPTGLVAYRIYQPGTTVQFARTLLHSGLFSGVDFAAQWCNLEPSEGVFDWAPIQEVFNEVRGLNGPGGRPMFVTLSIIPGFESPGWVLGHRGVQTIRSEWAYQGKVVTPARYLPLPWNQTYLELWYGFLRHLAAAFGDDPQFRMIAVGGPTSVSDEMSLPNWTGDASAHPPEVDPAAGAYGGSDIEMWEAAGYTPESYIGAWAQTFHAYHRIFPDQYLSLALIDGLPIGVQTSTTPGTTRPGPHPLTNKRGPSRVQGRLLSGTHDVIDAGQITATTLGVIAAGMKLRSDFVLQADGLGASSGAQEPFGYVEAACGRIDTGFQTHAPQVESKDNAAGTGKNAPLLKADLTPGVAAGARFLEVYASSAAIGLSHPGGAIDAALQYGKNALEPTQTKPRPVQPCEPLRIVATTAGAGPRASTTVQVTYETALLSGTTFTQAGLPGLGPFNFTGRLAITLDGNPLPVSCTPETPTEATTTCTATVISARGSRPQPGRGLKFAAALEIGYSGTYQPVVTATIDARG